MSPEAVLGASGVPREARPKLADFHDGFAMLWAFAFQAPVLAGMGPHWTINESEAARLSEVTEGLLTSMPTRRRKALEKMLSTGMPAAMFIITLGMIAGPRVKETQRLIRLQKEGSRNARPNVPTTVPKSAPSTGAASAGNSENPVGRTLPIHEAPATSFDGN